MSNKPKCIVCGKEYSVCLSCKNTMGCTPWKVVADSVEHYKIFQILTKYANGYFTKTQAKDELAKVNYVLDDLKPEVKDKILEITAAKTAAKSEK